jgi:ribosomal protein L35AE/L33A
MLSNRGKHISFQRAKHSIRPNTSLIKIEGVDDTKAATFYNGKRIAYVYRGKKEIRGTKIRVIWGKVTRPHGTFSHIAHHTYTAGRLEKEWRMMVARRECYMGSIADGN